MKGMKKKQIKDKHQPIDKLRKRRLFNADDDRGSSSVSSSPLKRSTRSTGSIIDPLKNPLPLVQVQIDELLEIVNL